jgi:hypothetical protein
LESATPTYLDKAVKQTKAAEMVKAHQEILQVDNDAKITAVHNKKGLSRGNQRPGKQPETHNTPINTTEKKVSVR